MIAASQSTPIVFRAFIYSSAIAALIFLPYGLSMMGLIEEWDILYYYKKFGLFYIADTASPLPMHRLRPLTIFPFSVAYQFSPNAIWPYNVLNALALVLKASAVSIIFDWLFQNRRQAVIGALIFMVYPADTMQMALRSFHINWALALTLIGVAALLDATRRSNGLAKYLELALAASSFLVGSLIYEAGLFLAPLPLLFWWARYGWSGGLEKLRRQALPVSCWCIVVLAAAGYLVVVGSSGSSYQVSVTGQHITGHEILSRLGLFVKIGLYRMFLNGWFDGFRMLHDHFNYWPFLVAMFFVVASVFLIPSKFSHRHDQLSEFSISGGRLIAAGLITAFLGYLPYLTSFSHIMTSQRTFLYAALGCALFTVTIIGFLARRQKAIAAILSLLLMASGLGAQWQQMSTYGTLSARQRAIIAGILEAAPDAGRSDHKRLLILDRSGTTTNIWMLKGDELRNALTYFYGVVVDPIVCTDPQRLYSSLITDSMGLPGRCQESEKTWDIAEGLGTQASILKGDLKTLVIQPDLRVTPIEASTPSKVDPEVTARWEQILGCWPSDACAVKIPSADTYEYEFGKYWGLDDVPWGEGWRDVEWNLPSLNPTSWSWIIAPQASLWFPIAPAKGIYEIRTKLFYWISSAAKESLRLDLNGNELEAIWVDEKTLVARVDSGAFKPGLNRLGLSATLDPKMRLSVGVDKVSVSPIASGVTH